MLSSLASREGWRTGTHLEGIPTWVDPWNHPIQLTRAMVLLVIGTHRDEGKSARLSREASGWRHCEGRSKDHEFFAELTRVWKELLFRYVL